MAGEASFRMTASDQAIHELVAAADAALRWMEQVQSVDPWDNAPIDRLRAALQRFDQENANR